MPPMAERMRCPRLGPAATTLLLASALGWLASAGWAQTNHNVELLGHLDLHSEYKDVWGYRAPDGTEIAIIGTSEGTQVVDVSDPRQPSELLFLPGPISNWREMKTYQSFAYIVNDNRSDEALQIVDLTDPGQPVKVYGSSEFFNRAHTVFIDGSTLYALGTDIAQGYVALDLADPIDPTFVGSFDEFYIHDIFVEDGVAYAAQVFDPGFLALVDVRDPAAPVVLNEVSYAGAATHNAWLTEDGKHCVTSDETAGGHVRIWNVEDPSNVFQVAEWSHPDDEISSVHNVYVLGSRIYCSWYTAGLEVLDLSRPEFPQRVANYDTYPASAPPVFAGAWGVYPFLPSGVVLIADMQSGLYTFRVDPVTGTARIRVRDLDTGEPVAADLTFPDEPLEDELGGRADPEGHLDLLLTPGTQRAIVTSFGFETTEVEFEVVRNEEVTVEVDLAPLPSGSLSGAVWMEESREGEVGPIEGVQITVLETPLMTRSSETGAFELPLIPEGSWTVQFRKFGYRSESVPVEITAGENENRRFELLPSYVTDDFESDRGWTVGAPEDDANSGIWERGNPIGTGGGRTAPEDDASEQGVNAFVTGNGGGDIGHDDVDGGEHGGQTTLSSTSYDLSQTFRPWLVFQLWYESSDDLDPNSDQFTVDVSTDGGISWTTMMRVSENTDGWSEKRIAIGRFAQLSENVRFRFIARDSGIGSIVEVGLDDVQIYPGREGEPYYDELPDGAMLVMDPPFPNPFLDQVRVQFRLGAADRIGLEVFDAAGRRIRRVSGVEAASGPGHLIWDGRTDLGHRVPSGAYWMVLHTSTGDRSVRVVRIR